MTIDTHGKWWIGDDPNDLREYLEAYTEDGYKTDLFKLATCKCGSVQFEFEKDGDEGVARRTCVGCKTAHFMCDSGEYMEDASLEQWECIECESVHANVGVGFSGYEDDPTGIRWIYVGVRCAKCGILGSPVDWKVALSDALDLLEKV